MLGLDPAVAVCLLRIEGEALKVQAEVARASSGNPPRSTRRKSPLGR
jgi:hypothetical protein